MKVKSLPTEYRGTVYRSRTEARWAVFFTENDIPFRYEFEGFELDGLRYLPDFWLPEGKCWFEVKPFDPTPIEVEKARRLARGTGRMVFLAPGSPVKEIGLYAFSPTGKTQENWQFAYAHEDGIGYIACDTWRADLWVRIKQTDAAVGCYGMGPEDQLNEAGNHMFDKRRHESGYDRVEGVIYPRRGTVIQVPQKRTIRGFS